MKTRTIIVTLALCLAAAAECLANPHLGTWKLNEAKSKMPPGMGKNTTVVYTAEGEKTKVTVDGAGKDGKPTHGVWVGNFDGKVYPVKGNLPYTALIYTVVNDYTNKPHGDEGWQGDVDGHDHGVKGWEITDRDREWHRRERKEI